MGRRQGLLMAAHKDIYFESIQEAFMSGSIKLDWRYKHKPIDINNIDDLTRSMRGGSIISSFITRLYTKLTLSERYAF